MCSNALASTGSYNWADIIFCLIGNMQQNSSHLQSGFIPLNELDKLFYVGASGLPGYGPHTF